MTSFLPMQSSYLLLISLVFLIHGQIILYCKECFMTSFLPVQSSYLLLISLVFLIHGQQSKGVVRVQHLSRNSNQSFFP